jgi:hypothetical protein
MANIKQVSIHGHMPFNITDDVESARWIGIISAPLSQMKIAYGGEYYKPNDKGGKLCMVGFSILGTTSMMFCNLQNMVDTFTNAGAHVDDIEVHDIEDCHDSWVYHA